MIVECDARAFSDLRNPYTGEPFKVVMLVTGAGEPLFRAEGSYSTADARPTSEQALSDWSRVDGVSGLRDISRLRCAYTGDPLGMSHDDEGFHLTGGFNPGQFRPREEFMYYATMRDGVPSRPEPESVRAVYVQRAEVSAKRKAKAGDVTVTQDAMDVVESAAEECPLPKSGTVSMHVSRKRK